MDVHRAVIGVFLLRDLNGHARCGSLGKMREDVGQGRLLAAEQHQRKHQGQQRMVETMHGVHFRARRVGPHPTRHLSRLEQISSRGRSRPMKTMVLRRASSSSQGRSSVEPKII